MRVGNFPLNCILLGLGWLLLLLSLLGNARSLKTVSFIWGEKKHREKSQKIVKMLYFDIAAKGKKKKVFFPITIEFVILEM